MRPESLMTTNKDDTSISEYSAVKRFYDETYYVGRHRHASHSWHLAALAKKLHVGATTRVLDVACGRGEWLAICSRYGAEVSGVDISSKAIEYCRNLVPAGEFTCCPAEEIPFEGGQFDLVTCLGSMEHFLDPAEAIKEMCRVSASDATLILLVPNAGFLTRKIGLFGGTEQVGIKEDVKSRSEWVALFQASGLNVLEQWRDLHILSMSWIMARGWSRALPRALQALALVFWPMSWQYQIYFKCTVAKSDD